MKFVLADVAEINPRLSERLADQDQVSFLGMPDVSELGVSSNGHARTYDQVKKGFTSFERDDVLFAKITPCFENGKIAQASIDQPVGFGSTEFHVVRGHAGKLDQRYILHYLRTGRVRAKGELRMTGSAGQRRVPAAFLEQLEIPLPPLAEQRRIAAILDQADALRTKRRESIAKLEGLVAEVYSEMIEANEFKMAIVSDVANSMSTGPFGSDLLHSEFVDSGIAVLGIDNAVQNRFVWGERRFITGEKYEKLARYTVNPGDVLITIMGTCGRCAVVPDHIPVAINTKHLCRITLDRAKVDPRFMHASFLYDTVSRDYLERTSKGSIMSGLNLGIIKKMPIPVPPLDLQTQFAGRVERVDALINRQQAHLAELDALFASLKCQAFSGEPATATS